MKLPSLNEITEKEGVLIAGIVPAAKILKLSPAKLKQLIERKGMFKDLYLEKGKDFAVKGRTDNDAKYYFIQKKLELYLATQSLPTPEELEKEFGTLITKVEAARLLKISDNAMKYRIEQGEYEDCYFKAGEDIHSFTQKFFFIKERIEARAMLHLPSIEELKQKYGDLVPIHYAARKYLNVRPGTFEKMIELGYFKDAYFTAGIDCQPLPRRMKYLFIEKRLKEINIKNHFLGTPEAAKYLNVSERKLRNWYNKGLLADGRISEYYWKIDWLEQNVDRIVKEVKNKQFEGMKESSTGTPLEWLEQARDNGSAHILDWIDDYANYICDGGIIEAPGSIIGGKKPKNKERKKFLIRRSLAILCYKIVCGRCGVKNYWEISRPGFYRPLPEEEREVLNFNVFKVVDFRQNDMSYASNGYLESNFYVQVETYLKPFMWYVFKRQKQELRDSKRSLLVNKEQKDSSAWNEYENKKDLLDLFEEDLEDIFESSFREKPDPLEENKRPAIHFTREQIILFDQNIKNYTYITHHGHLRHKFQDPLKRKALFLFGSFTGVRNEELCNLLIKDFELTKEGFLRRFELVSGENYKSPQLGLLGPSKPTDSINGYGLLKIRKDATKGNYGPSPEWGTYIAPQLVTVINEYLAVLYHQFPETRAKGFLFRSEDRLPDEMYAPTSISYWIWENRESLCDFLPESERNKYKYYDVRHTVADLILNQTKVPEHLRSHLERAAELHIRHDINNKSIRKSILRKNYAKDGTKADEYFSIMIEALDFPINIVGERKDSTYANFYDWEVKKGYRSPILMETSNEEVSFASSTDHDIEPISEENEVKIKELQEMLIEKSNFFEEISSGYRRSFTKRFGLSEIDWLELLPKLHNEITALESQINKLKVG